MKGIEIGCFCRSLTGHDKGSVYIVVANSQDIQVCDGRTRTLDKPKKKNPKHLEILEYRDAILEQKFADNRLHNEDIKYSIKMYLNHMKKMQEEIECQKQM